MDTLPEESQNTRMRLKRWTLNTVLMLLVLLVAYLSYALVSQSILQPAIEPTKSDVSGKKVIQLDVLNGCGVAGMAGKFTDYLRLRGFDVVESGNYKTFDVAETLVIDRVGDMETAKKVAQSLGVPDKNVIQQINPAYFLDVTVVIGHDYKTLRVLKNSNVSLRLRSG